MDNAKLNRPSLIIGIILVAAAVLMFLFGEGGLQTFTTAGIGILGLILIAVSRRK